MLTNRIEKYLTTIQDDVILNGLPVLTYYDEDNNLLGTNTFTTASKFSNKDKPNAKFKADVWLLAIRSQIDKYLNDWLDVDEAYRVELVILDKVWLSNESFEDKNKFDSLVKAVTLYNKQESIQMMNLVEQTIPNLLDDLAHAPEGERGMMM